jgi:hypothetical protein
MDRPLLHLPLKNLPAGRQVEKCVMKTSFRNGGVFVDENQYLR